MVERRNAQRGIVALFAKHLRQSMHDPDSFKLEDARLMDDGTGCYSYRARNGFGALRLQFAVLTPQLAAYSSVDSGFGQAWKKHCADKRGESLTAYINLVLL